MVKASGPGRRNPMIKIRELVSTVGSLRYEEVDGVRKEKERLTTDHQSYLHITLLITHFHWFIISSLTPSSYVGLEPTEEGEKRDKK